MDCDFYTPSAPDGIPTGEILKVKNSPYDFTAPRKIGDFEYDTNFVLKNRNPKKYFARAYSPDSGITLLAYTDAPGVMLYTANSFPADNGYAQNFRAPYSPRDAFCLETQSFPNSPNVSHFSNCVYKANEIYRMFASYKFVQTL
jgi:aldose 1-epimerase